MLSKIDIIVKEIKVIVDWYEENTDGKYTVGIEKAEELLEKLEGVAEEK